MGLLNNKKKVSRSKSIIFEKPGNDYVKEAYTRLKDNVLYLAIDGKNKVLQVESSVSGEAKTSTLANLGVCLSLSGKKVCIVDLDFRKPRLHRAFHLDNVDGIAEYMLDSIDLEHLIKKTSFENCDVINRGSEISNSSVVLSSNKLQELFNLLREKYDFILVDCPPVLLVSDFIHISRLTDGVIFVCAFGMTKKSQVREAIKQLKQNNIPILGSVYSFYDPKKTNYAYEYLNYGYYGYNDKSKR